MHEFPNSLQPNSLQPASYGTLLETNDDQIEILRKMTPAQRFDAFLQLYRSARRIKEAAFRQFHPDWSEDQIKLALRESFLHARS